MESSSSNAPGPPPADELEKLERAAVKPTILAMPVPVWVWPVLAALGSLFAYGFTADGVSRIIMQGVALAGNVLIAIRLASRFGSVPRMRDQPRRLKSLQARWALETAVLVFAMLFIGWKVNSWLAVVLAGPLYAVISYMHDARYEAATAEMRADRQ